MLRNVNRNPILWIKDCATPLSHLLTNSNSYTHKIILSPQIIKPMPNIQSDKHAHRVLLLVGPEGGFDNTEITNALNHHFTPLTLGNLTLRSETAAIIGIAALYARYSATWIK